MRVTRKTRLQFLSQSIVFAVLFLAAVGLLGWLSTQYVYDADWTYGHRNSLSPASVKLLGTLDKPLHFTAYAQDNPALRDAIRKFVGKYTAAKPDATLDFINPDTDPEAARTQGITANGELVIAYGGRSEKLTQYTENEVSNAIQRLARSSERYVVFLTGHGERDPNGQHNFDLGEFGKQLTDKGFKIESLNLTANPVIPTNTAVLVIAGPQTVLFPGEVAAIRNYVKRGGNLLWLGDPGPLSGLEPLARDLGVQFDNGTIVDPDSQLFGISDPTVIVVAKYESDSPVTRDFDTATVYATATAVETAKGDDWQSEGFLKTLPRSWLETGPLKGAIGYDAKSGDKLGPLDIGVSLTRTPKDAAPGAEQRVIVLGDGDFLSNAYLGNGGNLSLGLNLFNWLAHDDSYLDINPQPAPDLTLTLSGVAQAVIGFGFLLALPFFLLAAGIVIWIRRRRQ